MLTVNNETKSPELIFIIEFENSSGGMIHSVYELVSELVKYKSILILCPSGRVENMFLSLGVQVVTIGDATWDVKDFKLYYEMRKIIKKYNKSIFITNNILAQFVISLSSKFITPKIIYINRGGDLKSNISKAVLVMSGCIDKLITTSNHQKQVFLTNSLNRIKHIEVLGNPVSITKSLECRSNGERSSFVIGIVGYIDTGKNQLLAVESLYKLVSKGYDVVLNIYGEANNKEYLFILKEKIKYYDLCNRVNFKGYESNKEVIYSKIDVLVSTSLSEGFGRTLVEAMLYRVPVIALRCAGGPLDIIKENETGFLINNNSDELTNKIMDIMSRNKMTEYITNNAFLMASSKYHPNSIAKSFLSILDLEVM